MAFSRRRLVKMTISSGSSANLSTPAKIAPKLKSTNKKGHEEEEEQKEAIENYEEDKTMEPENNKKTKS